jgi:glycosyltransferase involved in cell wall biosynthesis
VDDLAHQTAFGKDNYIKISNGGFIKASAHYFRADILSKMKNLIQLLGVKAFYYTPLDMNYNPYWTHQLTQLGIDADVVMVEYVFSSCAFEAFPAATLRILDAHDAFSDRHKLYIAQGLRFGYWLSLRQQDENKGFRRADTVIAIQEEEATRFKQQLAAEDHFNNPNVSTVSHILKLNGAIDDYSSANCAVFLGSDNPSNKKSMTYFIDEILPLILRQIPSFNIKLIGTICNYIPDMPSVTKLGRVDDLKAAFSLAPLSLNPMRVGTGINIKLLDAMAVGVLTISTDTGARGLPASYHHGVITVADNDPITFAAEVVRLAQDEALRRQMGQEAFQDAVRWNAEQMSRLNQCLLGGYELL